MKTHLLRNTLSLVIASTLLSACGTDKGHDPGFKADDPIVFDMPSINASLDEETGIQAVDLLVGGMVNGRPLSGNVNISDIQVSVDQNFNTPQKPSNSLPNLTQSPFIEENGKLVVDTDAFSDRLSTCDTTDRRGARDDNDVETGDGFPDNPPQVTYTFDFAVDNGFKLQPGESLPRRTLTLTLNAVFDAVDSVAALPARVSLGTKTPLIASVVPKKACFKQITYSIANESIATIDAEGEITPVSIGETTVTVTSVDDPTKTITVPLDVFSEFTISISNQDVDANDLAINSKQVPACIPVGLTVTPAAPVGASLSGTYAYEWSSVNTIDLPIAQTYDVGFEGFARFSLGGQAVVGSSYEANVNLTAGDTGETPIDEIPTQTVTLNVVDNEACIATAQGSGFRSDYDFDMPTEPGAVTWNANQADGGEDVTTVAASDDGLDGTAMEITRVASIDDDRESFVLQGDFNRAFNFNAFTYGRVDSSIGRQFKYSVWVKLRRLPKSNVTLKQRIVPWLYRDLPAQQPGFSFINRFVGAGTQSAVLKATTEWQLVELIDEVSETTVWTVPESFNLNTPVFQSWAVIGLDTGDKILLDEYSIVEVTPGS